MYVVKEKAARDREIFATWELKTHIASVGESEMSGFITSFDTSSRYAVFHKSGCMAESGKFVMGRAIPLPKSVGMMAKNLQVVSFDADWTEIYLGTVRAGINTIMAPMAPPHIPPCT